MARRSMARRGGFAAVAVGLAAWGPRGINAGGTGGAATSAGAAVPVLIELFTLEGCSSCPPADALLTRLAAERAIGSAEIVTLAFHVDYWDRLGWKDRFSSAAFTEQDDRYAEAWKSDRVYAPQAVVDGRVEFVGTDVSRALEALTASAARPHARVAIAPGVADEPASKRRGAGRRRAASRCHLPSRRAARRCRGRPVDRSHRGRERAPASAAHRRRPQPHPHRPRRRGHGDPPRIGEGAQWIALGRPGRCAWSCSCRTRRRARSTAPLSSRSDCGAAWRSPLEKRLRSRTQLRSRGEPFYHSPPSPSSWPASP